MIEVLAPAGNYESLQAAVRSGADAVYFGASSFNARRNAENFTNEDIKDVVKYCHIRGVMAYLTLNTLISDWEMKDAMALVKTACKAGVDGIIVQDLGLSQNIRKYAPSMPLHASTQMTIHTVEGMNLLADLGFTRIVLARETPKDEIRKITAAAAKRNVTVEVFVHGALCMSVSGQCLFSAVLGGRSGNRGLCAGTCRLPFKVQGGNGYDLSLKDLCLFDFAREMKDMGVASLKIEGRMKSPEYVAMATHCAKLALTDDGLSDENKATLQSIFSRNGFTDGYYTEHKGADMFGARSEEQKIDSNKTKTEIHNIYRNEYQRVAINIFAKIKANTPCEITVSDGVNSATFKGDVPEIAINAPLSEDSLKEKLSKCGGTPYFVSDINIELDDGLMLKASQINELRRCALDKLTELRGNTKEIHCDDFDETTEPHSSKNPYRIFSIHNKEQIPSKTRATDIILLPLFCENSLILDLHQKGYNLMVKTPAVFFKKEDKIRDRLIEVKSLGISTAFAENLGSIKLIKDAGLDFFAGNHLNCYNSCSVSTITELGAKGITLSLELSDSQIASLRGNIQRGIVAYGRLPLMVLENCPRKARNGCADCDGDITDRKGEHFYLMCEDNLCKLYNNRPIYLGDRPRILNSVDFHLYLFTDESAEDVEKIIDKYEKGAEAQGIYTRGLYQKGVL